MEWIKGLLAKLLGKQVGDKIEMSKAKLTAVIAVILMAVQTLPQAFGHAPIVIPDAVYKFLAAAGLWAVRDALPPAPPTA